MILFASRHTKTLTLATEDGDVDVVIAALPRRHYLAAQQQQQQVYMEQVRGLGGVGVIKDIQALGGVERTQRQAAAANPLLQFDVDVLVTHGVKQINGAAPTTAQLEDLSPEAAEYIGEQVLRLTTPALYATGPNGADPAAMAEAVETERKNG
jgi:hypothetical protein